MLIEAGNGVLSVRFGTRFSASEAERLCEAVAVFGPFSRLNVDFRQVRDFHDAALTLVTRSLRSLTGVRVALSGLTLHRRRILKHIGIDEPDSPCGAE